MLPSDHAQRRLAADEVHARPTDALEAPLRASFVALTQKPDERARDLITSAFALNDLEPAGVHTAVDAITETVDAVRLHAGVSDLAALSVAADGRAWTSADRPALDGWGVRGVPGVPGAWELTLLGPA